MNAIQQQPTWFGRNKHWLVLVLTSLLGSACTLSNSPTQAIAWIGDEPLRMEAFLQRWRQEKIAPIAGTKWERETLAAQRFALLNTMVAERLWLTAAQAKGIVISQAQLDGLVARSQQGYTAAEWQATLAFNKHTSASWQDHLQRTAIIQAYLQQEIYGRVVVYDEDIEQGLAEQLRQASQTPEMVHLYAVALPSNERAEQFMSDLRQGIAWPELWRKYQLLNRGPANGNLGFLSQEQLPKALLPCWQKPTMAIGHVIVNEQEVYVCQVMERKGATAREQQALRLSVERQLRLEGERNAQVAHLQQLWEEAPVRLLEEKLSVAN